MSIPTRCPKCEAKYRVKDELAGKRFVCKVCQSAVPVPLDAQPVVKTQAAEARPDLNRLLDDEDAATVREPAYDPAQETSTDLELYGDTTEELVLKRTSFDETAAEDGAAGVIRRRSQGSLTQQWAARLARNPYSIPGLVFLLAWIPFSIPETGFVWVVNIILMSLCLAGAATVKVLESLEISFDNPLDAISRATFGALAPSSNPPPSGVIKRKTRSRAAGYELAGQLLVMAGVLAVHTAILTLKWYRPW